MVRKGSTEDDSFKLAGKGLDTEFCIYCMAVRGCGCPISDDGDACVGCLKDCFNRSKGNVGSWTGLRDDLEFILDEELSNVMLCALHCEMRNTEQLLGSVGLFAHRCNALDDLNNALSQYGPESFKEKRLTVKLRKGQETAVEKSNIKVATFSGPTERLILKNLEVIMEIGLPNEKITSYYDKTPNAAKQVLLDGYSFCEYLIEEVFKKQLSNDTFVRDYGTHQESIKTVNLPRLRKHLEKRIEYWQEQQAEIEKKYLQAFPDEKKRRGKNKKKDGDQHLASIYASEVQKNFYMMVGFLF
ncbi:uncharacterized protein LOC116291030 [Actinia tenebrosa]|uniref:Uncharacterized protein LOC116291030 n=1 Tax=Actinia tenebrosa TaxID=6105 RepID=A0A6P8HGC3_ACTTE|nr:uncharacterized protein LOC116291030 [Actinia tenebrosa]